MRKNWKLSKNEMRQTVNPPIYYTKSARPEGPADFEFMSYAYNIQHITSGMSFSNYRYQFQALIGYWNILYVPVLP